MSDWKEQIQKAINDVIKEERLYEKAIYLAENRDKDGLINSFSICIWEKNYPDDSNKNAVPERNAIIVNIKDPALRTRQDALKLSTLSSRIDFPTDVEYVDNVSPYWIVNKDSEHLFSFFKELITDAVINYKSKMDSFGCCSKYNECSNARCCLHENRLFSKACLYRRNLEMGKVFYGGELGADC